MTTLTMYALENTVWAIQTKDNPEKLATYDTQHKEKQQKHNTIYVGHHYTTTNNQFLLYFFIHFPSTYGSPRVLFSICGRDLKFMC